MGLGSLKHRVGALNGNLELQTEKSGGVYAYLEFATERLVRKRGRLFLEKRAVFGKTKPDDVEFFIFKVKFKVIVFWCIFKIVIYWCQRVLANEIL